MSGKPRPRYASSKPASTLRPPPRGPAPGAPRPLPDGGPVKIAKWIPVSTELLMDDPEFRNRHPWLETDRRAKPNAWPKRFRLFWPLRRYRGRR